SSEARRRIGRRSRSISSPAWAGASVVLGIGDVARRDPDGVGIWHEHGSISWSELDEIVNRATNALAALALPRSSRVIVFAENSVETVIAHLAALHSGLVAVPVSYHLTEDELEYIVRDSGAALLIAGGR